MTLIQNLILSFIEGLTEFLPVSSTGHLIIAEKLLSIPSTDFIKTFNIFIQLGAILSVIFLYRQKLLNHKELLYKIILAFIPTGIIGLTLYPLIKNYLLDNSLVTVFSLFIGGLILLYVDYYFKNKKSTTQISKLNLKNLFSLGLFQSLAVIPGVSRSAATIVGGLIIGLSRIEAVEFSFLLALPTIAAATGLDLLKSNLSFSTSEIFILLVGFIISFITAAFAIKFFTKYISKNNFRYFAIYRIILALIVYLLIK